MMAISRTSTPQSDPAVTRAMPDRSRKIVPTPELKNTPAPHPRLQGCWNGVYVRSASATKNPSENARDSSGYTLHDAFQHELPQMSRFVAPTAPPYADLPSP